MNYRELFMYGPMSRADALLKKLDTQSNDAKFSLNHEASWIAENNSGCRDGFPVQNWSR